MGSTARRDPIRPGTQQVTIREYIREKGSGGHERGGLATSVFRASSSADVGSIEWPDPPVLRRRAHAATETRPRPACAQRERIIALLPGRWHRSSRSHTPASEGGGIRGVHEVPVTTFSIMLQPSLMIATGPRQDPSTDDVRAAPLATGSAPGREGGAVRDNHGAPADAREAIRQQLHHYCCSMDRRDHELGCAVWHADGTADYGTAIFKGTGRGFRRLGVRITSEAGRNLPPEHHHGDHRRRRDGLQRGPPTNGQ